MKKRLLSVVIALVVGIAALAVLGYLFRGPLIRLAVGAIGYANGYSVRYASLSIGSNAASATGVAIERGGVRLLDVSRVDLSYDLHDALFARTHRYGVQSLSLAAPRLWIERKPDGSWNLPPLGGGSGAGSAAPATPLRISGTLRDGEVVLDDARAGKDRTALRIASIQGSYRIDTASTGEYRLDGNVDRGGPVRIRGMILARNDIARTRIDVAAVALAPLLALFVDPASVRFSGGTARDLHAFLYAHKGGGTHLVGSGTIADLHLSLASLRSALTIGGKVSFFDGGLGAKSLAGEIAAMPLHGAGIIYGLPAAPRFALAAQGFGELRDLRGLFAFSHALPIAGPVSVRLRVGGLMADPIVLARVESAQASYGAYELRGIDALVGYHDNSATIVSARAQADGLDVITRGALDTSGPHAPVILALNASGAASAVPYLGHVTGAGRLNATAAGTGTSDAFQGSAALTAAGNDGSRAFSAAAFSLRGHLNAPFVATRPGGSGITGRLVRNEDGRLAFWADVRHFAVTGSRAVDLGDSGNISGVLDGRIGGAGDAKGIALVGSAQGGALRIGRLALDQARAEFVPAAGGTHFNLLAGRGPAGSFRGTGELAGTSLGLRGDYDGSFEALRPLTGDLGGRGRLHGPLTVLIDTQRLVVQSSGIAGGAASVRGVPLEQVAGTLTIAGDRIHVVQAVGTVAGGRAVAAGGLERLGVLANGMAAGSLAAAGVPLRAGRLALAGTARFGSAGAAFDGGTVLNGGRYGDLPVNGTGALRYDGASTALDASGALGGSPLAVAGTTGVGGPAPHFDLHVDALGLDPRLAPGAPVALRRLNTRLDVRGRVWGTARSPGVDANLDAAAGFYGPLPFTDFAARVRAAGGGGEISNGRIAVGSTRLSFGGAFAPSGDLHARVAAPRLDLGDFDLYFYRAGTLAGTGALFASAQRSRGRFGTSGDVRLSDFVMMRPAGDAEAAWHMQGAAVIGVAQLTAQSNFVRVQAHLFPDPGNRNMNPLAGALVSATVRAEDNDLLRDAGLVVPAGFPALTGKLSAAGVVEGHFPDVALAGTATLRNGSVGRFGFEQASVSGRVDRLGATVTDARAYALDSKAQGSGYIGFDPAHRLNLRVSLESPQVHDLISSVANRPIELFGSVEASARLTGTLAHPTIDGAAFMPGGSFRGVTIARAIASYSVTGRDVQLTDATIDLAKGSIVLAGSLPIRVNPLRIGRRGAAVSFDLFARNVDLSNFQPLLPEGSKLAGSLNGRFGVAGTVRRPALYGSLALSDGAIATPALSDPLSGITGNATFSGDGFTIDRLSAKAGSGLLEATAAAAFREGQPVLAVRARATQALLGTPPIGRGVIDADLAYDRPAESPGTLSGNVTLTNATIPFSALYAPAATGPGGSLPDVALDVQATVGKNVRVRSGNVDIAGAGAMKLSGTLNDPRLDGSLEASPGGTIVYGNRAFRLQDGSVVFTPQSGLDPQLAADATVQVPNSDPDPGRNPTGSATVALRVTGSLSNPTVTLSSTPPYSSDQILGLLIGAPALGASLFGTQTAGGVTTGAPRSSSSNFQVGQEALGLLNAQFTRLLLAPFENSLSQALGLTSVDLNIGGASALGVSARKLLGKDVFAVYSSSFVYPYRQTFGFELRARRYTSAQVLYFQSLATNVYQYPLVSPFENQGSIAAYGLSQSGSQGFTISVRQYYPPP